MQLDDDGAEAWLDSPHPNPVPRAITCIVSFALTYNTPWVLDDLSRSPGHYAVKMEEGDE